MRIAFVTTGSVVECVWCGRLSSWSQLSTQNRWVLCSCLLHLIDILRQVLCQTKRLIHVEAKRVCVSVPQAQSSSKWTIEHTFIVNALSPHIVKQILTFRFFFFFLFQLFSRFSQISIRKSNRNNRNGITHSSFRKQLELCAVCHAMGVCVCF